MPYNTIYAKVSILSLWALIFVLHTSAKNYYISNKGSDNNTGGSVSQPWQTISKLNSTHFYPGDSIFFKGGDTISGIIYVTAQDSGTDANPVVFSSYGNGRAVINGGTGATFYGYNSGGFTIENINFIGSGWTSNTNSGVIFYTDTSNGHKFKHIYIDHCDLYGFGQSGIVIGGYHSTYPGYDGIRITNVNVNSVGQKGIFLFDFAGQTSSLYGHKNLYIGHCKVMHSGIEGILVSGVDSGLVEYCRAGYTGDNTDKGDAGIWAYSSNNITFQYCISDHTTTQGSDGEGFDLDGGTQNCVIQYCYAYQNYACGFMHCDYPNSRQNYNNIIRYSISENDGRKPEDNESSFLFISWGSGIDHCYMYNNTAFISDNGSHPVSAFRGYILTGSASNPYINNCLALNNILYIRGANQNSLVSLYNPNSVLNNSNILFAGNCYFSTNSQNWVYNNNIYTSLRNWQDSTGEETINGTRTGYLLNPGLVNPGGGGAITNPDSLKYMSAYKLKANDPIIGRGLNIDSSFHLKSPPHDFYGDTLKPFEVYSIGADDPQPDKYPKAGFDVKNTCLGDTSYFTDSSSGAASYFWNFGDSGSMSSDTSTLVSPKHKYNQPGTYTVVQEVKSVYGYNDTLKKIIIIYPKPVAIFSTANSCASAPVYFIESSLNSDSFLWSFGDSDSSNLQKPTHVYKTPGPDTIKLTVYSSNGCKDTASKIISIFPKPQANFTFSNVCDHIPIFFIDTSNIIQTIFGWNFGDGSSVFNMPDPEHTYASPGKYNVYMIATSGDFCKDTVYHSVEVYPLPEAKFTSSITGLVLMTKAIDSTETFYSWNFGDMDSISGIYDATHYYAKSGTYVVKLTVQNSYSCQSDSSEIIVVQDSGSGIQLNHGSENSFSNVYPNPFNNEALITYSIQQPGIVIISISNEEGKQISILSDSYQTMGSHTIEIDAEILSLKVGTYLIKMQSGGQIATIKLEKL